MNRRRTRTCFVTGTDTGVGKTLISTAILYALRELGLSTAGLKPLAAGATQGTDGWVNDDALMLRRYQTADLAYQQVNPVVLRAPIAPHIAARREGRRVTLAQLEGYCRGALLCAPDVALVEGAGGWRVPVNDREYLSGLPLRLGIPVLLVVGIRLGCINQALLTAEAIQRDGAALLGWIANVVEPDMCAVQDNIDALERALPTPLLATVPWTPAPTPEGVAELIDVSVLTGGSPPATPTPP